MLASVKEIGSGFLVGAANIIPGVSGGTLLFLLGLYERTLGALGKFNVKSARALLRSACSAAFSGTRRKDSLKLLGAQAQALDIPFIVRLLAGAAAAILCLSGLMEYLLEKHFSNTYAFFFGLILMSAVMSLKMMKNIKPVHITHIALGAAVTVAITASVDPSAGAKMKSERYELEYAESTQTELVSAGGGAAKPGSLRLKYTGRYTAAEFAAGAGAGAVAVSAMLLPGLSGSLVLILLGKYHEVISAISGLKSLQLDYFVFLTIMAAGMGFGLIASARLINYVFKRFHDGTVAVMLGLIVGSLYALWPFKQTVVMNQYVRAQSGITLIENAVMRTNINILPGGAAPAVLAALFCAAGIGVMALLSGDARKK